MLDPFTKSPPGASLKADKLFYIESEKQRGPAEKLVDGPVILNFGKCESRLPSISVCIIERNYPTLCASPKSDSKRIKPLMLTDCFSLFSIILRMQPNANGRCARIILSDLRDSQALIAIRSVDASVDIGDAGAKHGWNNAILYEFWRTGRFAISSVGRKDQSHQKKRWLRN